MTVDINGLTYELKFTFNSFKYMRDFNIGELEALETQPFKIIGIVEMLMMGALNHNPKTHVALIDVDNYLEEFINNGGDIGTLSEELINLLEESNFFKSIQKKPQKKTSKK